MLWISRKTPQKILISHIKSKVKHIFCGPDTSAVLFENGEMHVCGSNDYNKLGFEKSSKIMALVGYRFYSRLDLIHLFFIIEKITFTL